MKVVKIDKSQWTQGLTKSRESYQLYGPIKSDGFHSFKDLTADEQPDLTYLNTRLSPKALLFPQSEAIVEYSLDSNVADHHIQKSAPIDERQRAVIGIHPCDAKSITLLNLNFDTAEYQDPYWAKALAATTFIGLACDEPRSTCFCTSAGCGPYDEAGLDILLVDQKDAYLAKVLTEKGQAFIETAGWDESLDAVGIFEANKKAAEAKIGSTISTDNLKTQDILSLHSASFWEDVSFACLNCGTCTYTCPTCWCFDLQDEVRGKSGKRFKNWDSCMFPLFTLHTTGHNPRGTKMQRVRQRFMHKLKYFVDKYDQGIMCVGCGRCVNQCPVNIDIRAICEIMNAYEGETQEATAQA
jgi:ferredoxin